MRHERQSGWNSATRDYTFAQLADYLHMTPMAFITHELKQIKPSKYATSKPFQNPEPIPPVQLFPHPGQQAFDHQQKPHYVNQLWTGEDDSKTRTSSLLKQINLWNKLWRLKKPVTTVITRKQIHYDPDLFSPLLFLNGFLCGLRILVKVRSSQFSTCCKGSSKKQTKGSPKKTRLTISATQWLGITLCLPPELDWRRRRLLVRNIFETFGASPNGSQPVHSFPFCIRPYYLSAHYHRRTNPQNTGH